MDRVEVVGQSAQKTGLPGVRYDIVSPWYLVSQGKIKDLAGMTLGADHGDDLDAPALPTGATGA